jgi:hypothetical protein
MDGVWFVARSASGVFCEQVKPYLSSSVYNRFIGSCVHGFVIPLQKG